jgi:hypothetical protein
VQVCGWRACADQRYLATTNRRAASHREVATGGRNAAGPDLCSHFRAARVRLSVRLIGDRCPDRESARAGVDMIARDQDEARFVGRNRALTRPAIAPFDHRIRDCVPVRNTKDVLRVADWLTDNTELEPTRQRIQALSRGWRLGCGSYRSRPRQTDHEHWKPSSHLVIVTLSTVLLFRESCRVV